jgi:uncharacterized protein (TIGR03437 family)
LEASVRSFVFALTALLVLIRSVSGGVIAGVTAVPDQISVVAFAQDSSGNLYVAGAPIGANTLSQNGPNSTVLKLSSDGKTILFSTVLPASLVGAMALAADGAILVAGETSSTNFPVTANAAEPQNTEASDGNITGFFARLNSNGAITYATYLNGSQILGIATDASGAAYITGQGLVDSTPGALPTLNFNSSGWFVTKIDATGKIDFITGAIGGNAIAVDSQGSIYVTGAEFSGFPLPVTAGAYQSTVPQGQVCGGDINPDGGIALPCGNQYVVKLNPTGSAIVYATWLSGGFGAVPAAIWVDSEGNAVVAGSTQSADYPITTGAFQTSNFATSPPLLYVSVLGFPIQRPSPPATGYVSKLNASGNALIFSTYLGGSGEDSITTLSPDSEGNFYLSGLSQSPDFPGLPPTPDQCRPSFLYSMPFVTRLSADGSSLTETQLVFGFVTNSQVAAPLPLATFGAPGTAGVAFGNLLASLNLYAPQSSFVCATDAADLAPLAQFAPGQLLSLFGEGIGVPDVVAQPQNGKIPTDLESTTVSFNGVAAPVLYSSPNQINVQVPYEIAAQPNVQMEIAAGGPPVGSGTFLVTPLQPSAFAPPQYAACQAMVTLSVLPLALNADGTLNSCANPASVGSVVTLFVNGLGSTGASPVTGAISTSPATPLALPVTVEGTFTVAAAETDPGSINGVWQVKLTVDPPNSNSSAPVASLFSLTIGGVALRDSLVLWVSNPPQ